MKWLRIIPWSSVIAIVVIILLVIISVKLDDIDRLLENISYNTRS